LYLRDLELRTGPLVARDTAQTAAALGQGVNSHIFFEWDVLLPLCYDA